jgi:gliding motility-associated-like protein
MSLKSTVNLLIVLCFSSLANGQVLQWNKKLGGDLNDNGFHSVVDKFGNLYLSGSFQGSNVDFDPGPGIFQLSSAGLNDGFVAKYDASGKFVWAFRVGGTNRDEVGDIALDSAGNFLITGFFRGQGVDFDPSANNALLNSNGENGSDPGYGGDIFVAKYDTAGNYKWAFNIGGDNLGDNGISIYADKNNDVLVTGYFRSTVDFDPSAGVANLNQENGTLFIAKYNANGQYQWAFNTGQGGNVDNTGFKIISDNLNNVIVTGFFQGTNIDFDPSAAVNALSSNGSFEYFIAKYSPTGQYLWAKSAGGSGVDVGRSLTVDKSDNIYATGDYSSSSINFNNGQAANTLNNKGGSDLFLVKYSPSGQHLWSFGTGGPGNEYGMSIYRDDLDNVLIGGTFTGINVDFDPSLNTISLSSNGGNDIYAVKYSASGAYLCAFSVGGPGDDMGKSIVNYGNYSYLTGTFNGTNIDFDPLDGTSLLTSSADDAFFAKYDWTIVPPAGSITGKFDCATGLAQMTFTATSGLGPFTLYVNDGTTTRTYPNIQSGVSFQLTPSPTKATQYTLTGIKDANRCSAVTPSNATITIGPTMIPIITSGNNAICKNDSIQLSASGGTGYTWSPTAGLSNPAIANPKASPAVTTTYKVVVFNSVGCKDSATLTINVKSLPAISVAPISASFCEGDSVQLSASGGSIYQWSPAAGLSNSAIPNPKASPKNTTAYKLVVTTTDGCKDSTNKVVTRNVSPVVLISSPAAICQGDSIQLQASGGVNYQWFPAAGLNHPTIAAPKASPANTTIYKVIVSSTEGCKDSAFTTITTKAKPVLSISPSTTVCKGDSAQLLVSGAVSYQWLPSSGLNNAAAPDPKTAPAITTNYTVLATGTNGCIDSAKTIVNVNPLPTITLSPDGSVCKGDSVQLIASGGVNYQWSPSASLNNPSIANPKASPTAAITYKVIVNNVFNCKDSAFVTIAVKAKPVVKVTAGSTICKGDSIQLVATGGGTYQWKPSTGLSNALVSNPIASPQTSTNYSVVVTNAEGCQDSLQTSVSINPKPKPNLGKDTLLCTAENLMLNAFLPTADSYSWSTGEITPSITVNKPGIYSVSVKLNNCKSPTADTILIGSLPLPSVQVGKDTVICNASVLRVDAQGNYIESYLWNTGSRDSFILVNTAGLYKITAENKCGNVSDSILVKVEVCSRELYFPSAFTPNHDGRNDVFKAAFLQGTQVYDYELRVYNRWGEEVFTTNDIKKGWDGRVHGKDQETDVFVWYAKFRKTPGGQVELKKGTVTLIR